VDKKLIKLILVTSDCYEDGFRRVLEVIEVY